MYPSMTGNAFHSYQKYCKACTGRMLPILWHWALTHPKIARPFTFANNHTFECAKSVLQRFISTKSSRTWNVHRTCARPCIGDLSHGRVTCHTWANENHVHNYFGAPNKRWRFENGRHEFLWLFGAECGLWFKELKGLYSPSESLKCMAYSGDGQRRSEVLAHVLCLEAIRSTWTSSMKQSGKSIAIDFQEDNMSTVRAGTKL